MHPLKNALVTYWRVMGAASRWLSTKLRPIYAAALGMIAPAEPIPDSSPEGKEQRLAPVLRWRVAALVVALAALGYTALQKRAAWRTPVSVAPRTARLALEVERHENDLRLNWNRNTPMVDHAREAVLSIHDGNSRQELHLGREELRTGNIVYSRVNSTVQFRLEITAPDDTKTSESVLVLTAAGENAPAAIPIAAKSNTSARGKRARLAGRRSRTKPLLQSGRKLPFICSAGNVFRKTDAPPGWDTFVCRGKNVWGLAGGTAVAANSPQIIVGKRN